MSEQDEKAASERILEALQAEAGDVFDDEEGATTGVITDFVVIVEWMADDGKRWLSRLVHTNSVGWRTRGLLFEALHNWPENE